MQKLFKITLIVLIIIMTFGSLNRVYALTFIDELEGRPTKTFDPQLDRQDDEDTDILTKKVGKILGVIQVIGIIISVIALMIIGIKEMVSSVEERSIIKQSMPVYILGVFMIAAVTTIPKILYDIAQNIK